MDDLALGEGLEPLALLEHLRARLIRPLPQVNPGAGQELVIPAPGDASWELLALRLTFTASAAVANRHPALSITDPDGKEYLRIDPQIVIAAAGVVNLNFAAGLGYVQAAEPTLFGLPAPPLMLLPGWSLRTVTALLDAADAYTNVRLLVREFEEHRTLEQIRWLSRHLR